MNSITISQSQDGQRLDNALITIFPSLSLRARRRLWENWHICIDGKAQGAGYRVRSGQQLSAKPKTIQLEKSAPYIQPQVQIIQENNNFIFIHKPSGLHSTRLEHGGLSLEDILPELLPTKYTEAKLCNRLDSITSGIVVVAKHNAAKQLWQELENAGQCQKKYLALVGNKAQEGPPKECKITVALNTDKRKKSRILAVEAEALRHTYFKPLTSIDEASYTKLCNYFPSFPRPMPYPLHLIACTIYKGSRHQIRAHAAHAGFALYNDLRYHEQNIIPKNECFLLHHGVLILPHETVFCHAPWEGVFAEQSFQFKK